MRPSSPRLGSLRSQLWLKKRFHKPPRRAMAGFISSLLRVRTAMPATLNAGILMIAGVFVMAGPLWSSMNGIDARAAGRRAGEAWCVHATDKLMSVAWAHAGGPRGGPPLGGGGGPPPPPRDRSARLLDDSRRDAAHNRQHQQQRGEGHYPGQRPGTKPQAREVQRETRHAHGADKGQKEGNGR